MERKSAYENKGFRKGPIYKMFRRKRRAPEETVRVVNVIETANNTEDVSRQAVLRWINESLAINYEDIKELCSGEREGGRHSYVTGRLSKREREK